MSLTKEDLQRIHDTVFSDELRQVVREEVRDALRNDVPPMLESLKGDIEAILNDVKEIYDMIANLQKLQRQISHIEKYDLEQKVIKAYKDIIAVAQAEGITLPQ